jgi:hypothetical protein
MAVVYSRWLFVLAGLSGLALLLPMYLMKDYLGSNDPPAITHPEFYYGFVGVAIAWQVLFLIIAVDPLRYRPVIVPAVLEKLGYSLAVIVLYRSGQVSLGPLLTGIMDLTLGVLFAIAYVALSRRGPLD